MPIYNFPEGPINCSDISCQDFTGNTFVDIPDGSYVYGACFSQETPWSRIFRENMRNVTFRNCNMMNVYIPQSNNNIVIDCQTDSFQVQNDLNDWILDSFGNPVKPVDHIAFTKRGLPMPLPSDIPAERVSNRIDLIEVAKAKVSP
jgi:hypothetical protein